MAESKGQLYQVFLDRLDEMTDDADNTAEAVRGKADLEWDRPTGWSGNTLDIAGTTDAFDRKEIDAGYEEIIGDGENPGTVGDVVSAKIQGDYCATQERAYRAKACTPIRAMAMAMGRRKGHGHDKGVIQSVIQYAQDAIHAGQA